MVVIPFGTILDDKQCIKFLENLDAEDNVSAQQQ